MTTLSRISLALLSALLLAICPSVEGKTLRSNAVVREFKKLHPCPYEPGNCVADHSWPLCAGGKDAVSNLQWQRRDESYVKDAWERRLCGSIHKAASTSHRAPQPE